MAVYSPPDAWCFFRTVGRLLREAAPLVVSSRHRVAPSYVMRHPAEQIPAPVGAPVVLVSHSADGNFFVFSPDPLAIGWIPAADILQVTPELTEVDHADVVDILLYAGRLPPDFRVGPSGLADLSPSVWRRQLSAVFRALTGFWLDRF